MYSGYFFTFIAGFGVGIDGDLDDNGVVVVLVVVVVVVIVVFLVLVLVVVVNVVGSGSVDVGGGHSSGGESCVSGRGSSGRRRLGSGGVALVKQVEVKLKYQVDCRRDFTQPPNVNPTLSGLCLL